MFNVRIIAVLKNKGNENRCEEVVGLMKDRNIYLALCYGHIELLESIRVLN